MIQHSSTDKDVLCQAADACHGAGYASVVGELLVFQWQGLPFVQKQAKKKDTVKLQKIL